MPERWPVLTSRQPWCWSITHAGKPVENRSWCMAYRGPLWLHAGARSRWDPAGTRSALVQEAWERHVRSIPDWPGLPEGDVLLGRRTTLMPFGAVAALAKVRGCHHADRCAGWDIGSGAVVYCSPWAGRPGWHIELEGMRPLAEPLPCRGKLGLWYLPAKLETAARAQTEVTHA